MKRFRILVLSSFNAGALRGYLENLDETPSIEAIDAGFGQALATLARGPSGTAADAAFVWTRPEDVSEAFRRLLTGDRVTPEALVRDAGEFARLFLPFTEAGTFVMVGTWAVPASLRTHGAVVGALHTMNAELARVSAGNGRTRLMDTQRWLTAAGPTAWNARSWYLSKNPFSADVHREAARDVRAIVAALTGAGRKLIVLDLDDTLWGGILGDEGAGALRLGGHDPLGEAYAAFQRELLSLQRRGILLAIASKNDERVALEAIDTIPEMILRRGDFAAWRIDWNDKAANLAELVRGLHLGLQSTVFIDDSRIERERVRAALPEVLVPDWPADPALYVQALRDLDCFEPGFLTDEDHARARLYSEEHERERSRTSVGSYDEWLRTLEMRVRVEPLGPGNRERVVQLLNKTNQLNLATRRMSDTELEAWLRGGARSVLAFRVADRFGDAGLTGIVGLDVSGEHARLVDWVLSCRVMGRRVEETLIAVAAARARAAGARILVAEFVPTAKNAPTREFLERSGLVRHGDVFQWDLARPYPVPDAVRIEE